MGLLTRLARHGVRAEFRDDDDFWYRPGPQAADADTGLTLTREAPLSLSAFWKGIRLLSETVASLPCLTYRRLSDGGKERAPQHPLYRLLKLQPNAWQTAYELFEYVMVCLGLRGNAYIEIVEGATSAGVPYIEALIPIHPDRVTVQRLPSGRLTYRLAGTGRTLSQEQVSHIRGLSLDGLTGVSVIEYGARSISTAISADRFAGRFFRQGAAPAFAVIHPGQLGDEATRNLTESINSFSAGLEHSQGVLVLEEDVKVASLGIKPEEAQLLASREYSVEEVARWLNLPASMLGNTKTPTFASHAAFQIDLVTYSFRPWLSRIEAAILRDLVWAPDTYFAEFLIDALMRADPSARGQFYHYAISDGWMTRNEVREKENMNRADGLDTFLEPLNMGRADEPREQRTGRRQADGRAFALAHEAAARVVRKEIAAVQKAAQRFANDGAGWTAWLREFYGEHAAFVASSLRVPLPLAQEYAARQGSRLEAHGVGTMADWEWTVVGELAELALEPPQAA